MQDKKGSFTENENLKKELANSFLVMDMFGLLIGLKDEEDVIDTVIELSSMLFSPEQAVYAGVKANKITYVSKLKSETKTKSIIDLPPGSEVPIISDYTKGDNIIFPVEVWGETVGLLDVGATNSPEKTESLKNTARLFLPLCGLVVTNARNYHNLLDALDERDGEIELRKKAEHGLSGAIKKLSLLSGITRHDILNHIMVANYHLETSIEDSPALNQTLTPVIKSVSEIQRQIEFTRDYQDMGGSPPSWQQSAGLIKNCFMERDYPETVNVENSLPDIEIFADPMLQKAFCNVISNAYNHAEGMNNLKITGQQVDSNFLIRISDDGAGVPDDKKDLIFKAGHGRNHGYGLFLVREIFGLTDITIKETGNFGEGAVFEIKIPEGSWQKSGNLSA